MDLEEYTLTRKGYYKKLKDESLVLKFQTALICEAFIGGGKGTKFVDKAWSFEEKKELSKETVRSILSEHKKREAVKRKLGGRNTN